MTDLTILREYLNELLEEKENLDDSEAQFQSVLILQILDKIDELEENKKDEEGIVYD